MMTRAQFLRALRKVNCGWSLRGSLLRCSQDVEENGATSFDREFCPITAVCYDRTGQYYGTGSAHIAASKLRLERGLRKAVIDAADHAEPDDKLLRRSLLNACGVKEDGHGPRT